MFNVTVPRVHGVGVHPPCTSVQSNIIAAHMLALQYACETLHERFLLLETDAGRVSGNLSELPFPDHWCAINVCPTNTAEPNVAIRRAIPPYDFGAVAVVYNKDCVCNALPKLRRIFATKCEPFDSVIYRLPMAFRTGVMWIEHNYATSSHSDGWAHKIGHKLVHASRTYWGTL